MTEFESATSPSPSPRGRIVTGAFKHLTEATKFLGERYLLFVGICAIAYLLGGAVPFYIIYGAMMCGMFYCFREHERGNKVEIAMLFKGFDSLSKNIVPALVLFGATLVVLIPMQIMNFAMMASRSSGDEEAFLIMMLILMPIGVLLGLIVQAVLFFSFPLIMDRDLGGWESIKESFAALRENLVSVFVAIVLFMVLQFLGFAACCIGWFFVLPIMASAQWKLYREVYPDLGAATEPAAPDPTDWSSTPQ